MKIKIMPRILCSVLLTQLVLVADFLYSQSDFYRGKTITIIHGRSPGGSGDFRARAVAPFLQKYIPGNPTIVHEYMDGGGGRKAANHIFNSARPDGLTLGSVGGGVVGSAVLAKQGFSTISKSFISSARLSARATIYFRRVARPDLTPSRSSGKPQACAWALNLLATASITSAGSWLGSSA